MTALKDRSAMVCGATRGIGLACAQAMAGAGANVSLVARDAAALERERAGLATDRGQMHHVLAADFGDPEALGRAVTQHTSDHGPIEILVNNTGGPPGGPGFEADADAYLDAFTKHVVCNQTLAAALIPGMRERAYGRIINIISTSVVTPIAGLGVSNTIRGAVANWGRTLAGELAPFGITVNNLLPGFTATDRLQAIIERKADRAGCGPDEMAAQMRDSVPARRFADPAEIAAVALFLAGPDAGYVNGVNLPVDGGRLARQ